MTPRQDWFHKNALVQSTTFTLTTADTTSVHRDAGTYHTVATHRLRKEKRKKERKKKSKKIQAFQNELLCGYAIRNVQHGVSIIMDGTNGLKQFENQRETICPSNNEIEYKCETMVAKRTKGTRLTSRAAIKPVIKKKKECKAKEKIWRANLTDRGEEREPRLISRRDTEEYTSGFDSSYLALSGDTEPSVCTFHRNSSIMSTKIRSVAGCAVHYCRFKRCIKTLANGAAIERARIRRWPTVIAIVKRKRIKKTSF